MQSNIEISVVVPVYRSAKTLGLFTDRVMAGLPAIADQFELIFVDDCSPDNSWEVLSNLQAQFPSLITAVRLMRNFGQHNALMAGFHRAKGDIVVTLDDDLQHPPEEIAKLVTALRVGELDLVYGAYGQKQHANWRNLGSMLAIKFFQFVFQVSVKPTAFRAIRREVITSILPYQRNFTVVDGLLAWSTQRIGAVDVEHHPRAVGRSGYSIRKLVLQSVNVLTNFSLAPLQVVSAMGLLTSVAGLLLASYYLFLYFTSALGVPGYGSLIVTILVTSGLQLLSLGVIGEYLGRVLLNINMKPQYVERTVLPARTLDRSEPVNVRASWEA